VHASATPSEIFAGEEVLLDTIAKGVRFEMSSMVWKDFYQACTDMFNDTTFDTSLVPILFGLIPSYML
jgi:hypothetical protein